MNTNALTPVRVEDWTVFQGVEGCWIKDLDLARHARLAKERDIRATIFELVVEGALQVSGSAAGDVLRKVAEAKKRAKSTRIRGAPQPDHGKYAADSSAATGGATICAEFEVVSKGSRGGSQQVIVYYLDQEAALLVLTRLKTPVAVQVTRAVIKVFMAVARGEVVGPRLALLEREIKERDERLVALEIRVQQLDPNGSGVINSDRAKKYILSHLEEAARIRCAAEEEFGKGTFRGHYQTFQNEVRLACDFPASRGQHWECLEIEKLGLAQRTAISILEREKANRSGIIAKLKARIRELQQLTIPAVI